ncbi:MAG TPA: SpoIIE family protein phosphatase [Streptosporangiaceae bacterium]|nr:SpoIIE family protein phosphatase [Streptosporangiaceae bacterium]
MPQDTWTDGSDAYLADLPGRREALRQAAAVPGVDPRGLLDAAFAELDAAVEALTKLTEAAGESAAAATPDSLSAERAMLRAVFQHAPVPLFVLDQDTTVRRANARAGDLIGAPPGYATGKELTAFVDMPFRAAVKSQLAATARTGTARRVECKLLAPDGPADASLTAGLITLQDGTRLLVVSAGSGYAGPESPKVDKGSEGSEGSKRSEGSKGSGDSKGSEGLVRAMTRRMDMITAVTRLLLDNSTFSEAVTLQRCARLLAGGIANWVIVDVERSGQLRRQYVIGPHDESSQDLARKVRALDPQPGSVPAQVHAAGTSILLAHADDPEILGVSADETPVLMLLGTTSLLSVPITDGTTDYGALTLARAAGEGRFEIADLGLAEQFGQHLGVAIRVDRMFRHRSAVAEALQGSLLPATLPDVPGIDLYAAYLPAGEGLEVSGDFYDVFPAAGGWAIAVGDVCGKGQEAAAMTAAARHAIRTLAHWNPDPADVLAKANEIMLEGSYEDRFVAAKLAYLRWDGDRLRVELASAGHPGPALVRPDGRVEILDGGGLPLGLFPDADSHVDTLELSQDDLLFFYSDGVTDARNHQMRYFEDRLADELAGLAGSSAADTARAIQSGVTSFSEGELRDDLTILVAKVTGPP